MVDVSERFAGPPEADAKAPANRRSWIRIDFVSGLLAFQLICALFFLGEMWSEVLGLRSTPIPWEYREIIQILASLGLLSGVLASMLFLRSSREKMSSMGRQIDVASGNFEGHLADMFAKWQLSRSEQEVAIYAMKGFSNAEIADLRGTSAATTKSQMNAIYRKTGLGNRQQLISFLVEELLTGVAIKGAD